jgi:hypothetical protein
MKTTRYFEYARQRADRQSIRDEWIEAAIKSPAKEQIQSDGRIRRWVYVQQEDKYLRVILLEDGETVHNAFYDWNYEP